MGLRRHKKVLVAAEQRSIKKIVGFTSISGIASALIGTVWALYINSIVDSASLVGLITSFFMLISFLTYFTIIPLIEKQDKKKLLKLSSIIMATAYIVFALTNSFTIFLILGITTALVLPMRMAAMGLLVKSNSDRNKLSKSEGVIYTIANSSFLIGPLIAFIIIKYLGLKHVFTISALIFLLSIFLIKKNIREDEKKKRIDKNIKKNFMDFFKNKHRVKAYFLASGVNFWWSLVYIFLPLMIIKQLPEYWVGIVLAIVVIPLITLEIPFANLANKKGYKKIFFIGFLIPAIIALLCFFITNIWFIIITLTLASIGLAMLESTTESYFFDISKGKSDQRFYSPFNTAIETGSIFGRLLPAIFLIFLDIKYLFLFYFIGMLSLSLLSLRIKDAIESKRK